jgi:hypothetical protein
MLLCPFNARVFSSLEMLDDRCVYGDSRGACASAEGGLVRSIAEAVLQEHYDAITLE